MSFKTEFFSLAVLTIICWGLFGAEGAKAVLFSWVAIVFVGVVHGLLRGKYGA